MKKSDMTIEMMTNATKNRRCLYENNEICVVHQLSEFSNGDKEAIMLVSLKKKDGLFWRTESGATPIR